MVFGSDYHSAAPGHSGYYVSASSDDSIDAKKLRLPRMNSPYWCNGLTAVFADRLDLPGIFDALWSRRCYCCTGRDRPLIEFTIDGHDMGADLRTDAHPTIHCRIRAGKAIRAVHLIRNDREALRVTSGRDDCEFECQDRYLRGGMNYYYIRAVLADDEVVWTSPIWVEYTGRHETPPEAERPWNEEEVISTDAVAEDPAAREHKEAFLARLQRLAGDRFHRLKSVRLIDDGYGAQAVFFGLDRARADAHVRFMYLYEFERPLILGATTWTVFDSRRVGEWEG
jgi:hypothetical protein